MNESEAAAILTRLRRIEEALLDANRRIAELERAKGAVDPRPPVTPPPVPFDITSSRPKPPPIIFPETKKLPQPEIKPVAPPPTAPAAPPLAAAKARDINEVEYKIGLQGLLKGGAAVVVIALTLLVGLAISQQWITKQMQFGGEILLCLGFIGVGAVKRNEREEFGQLLTGIGSCGLYLAFAGAHVFKGIITGETLVALFVLLSLVNLGYALWRSSRSFLSIGLVGGLIASALPMRQENVVLDVALFSLILAPTAFIIRRNRWQPMAAAMWLAGLIALLPALSAHADWGLRLAALYGLSLLSAWLYAATFDASEFDPKCVFAIVVLMVGVAIGTVLDGRPVEPLMFGSIHVLLLAGLAAALSLTVQKDAGRQAMQLGGLLAGIIFLPVGMSPVPACLVYAMLGSALAASSLSLHARVFAILSWLELVLATSAYMGAMGSSPGILPGVELAMLGALTIHTVASAYASFRAWQAAENAFLVGALLSVLMLVRGGVVGLGAWQPGLRPEIAVLLTTLVYSWFLVGVGSRTKWMSAIAFGWASVLVALTAYVMLAMDHGLVSGFDLALLLAFMLGVAASGRITLAASGADKAEALIGATGFILGTLLVRAFVVVLSPPRGALWLEESSTIGFLAVAIIGAAVTEIKKVKSPLALAWVGFLLAFGRTLGGALGEGTALPHELPFLVALILTTLWLGFVTARVKQDPVEESEGSAGVIGFILSLLVVRLFVVVLSPPMGGLSIPESSTIGLLAVATLGAAVTRFKGLKSSLALGWIAFAFAFSLTLGAPLGESGALAHELPLLVALMAATLWLGFVSASIATDVGFLIGVCVALGWTLVSRLAWAGHSHLPWALKDQAALTAAWIAYAIGLIAFGFRLQMRHLRYWSLGIFGATVVKVFFVDIADLDPAVRVLLLLVLGIAMIGGGYAYIRMKAKGDASVAAEVEPDQSER